MPKIISFDQSFCKRSLDRMLWKSDFRGIPSAAQASFKEALIDKAISSANSNLPSPSSTLTALPFRGKMVYRLTNHHDQIVERKLRENLRRCAPSWTFGRTQIVGKLKLLLEEGVPYRVYRLDIRSFFESFSHQYIVDTAKEIRTLSPHSRMLIERVLQFHRMAGGSGIPRGLSLSAVLSEVLMRDFDQNARNSDNVFHYSRYIDDIIIISSSREHAAEFLKDVERWLPPGLTLNPEKKDTIDVNTRVKSTSTSEKPLEFEYLGYHFFISNPTKAQAGRVKDGDLLRLVRVDIAKSKIKKIKTRIARAFVSHFNHSDWKLLLDRVSYLTNNFSVYNAKAGGKKVAGIYHSYPLVSEDSAGLRELDGFLRNATLSKSGHTFAKMNKNLSSAQKRKLLSKSFLRGHSTASFVYFSASRISKIQECWKN